MEKEIVKVIGRISKKGTEYYQTAINTPGEEEGRFIPVFIKKDLEGKFHFESVETKVDKRGVVYKLYSIDKKDVFFVMNENGEDIIDKAIIMK